MTYPDRQIVQTHIIVALDSVDKSLISHNLCLPMEKGLETLFDRLQVLLTDLKETLTDRTPKVVIVINQHKLAIFCLIIRREKNLAFFFKTMPKL